MDVSSEGRIRVQCLDVSRRIGRCNTTIAYIIFETVVRKGYNIYIYILKLRGILPFDIIQRGINNFVAFRQTINTSRAEMSKHMMTSL